MGNFTYQLVRTFSMFSPGPHQNLKFTQQLFPREPTHKLCLSDGSHETILKFDVEIKDVVYQINTNDPHG